MYLSGAKVKILSELLVTLAEPHGEDESAAASAGSCWLLDADHYAPTSGQERRVRGGASTCARRISTYEARRA